MVRANGSPRPCRGRRWFRRGIVVGIPTLRQKLDTGLSQALGFFDPDVLATSVALVHKPAEMDRPSIVQGLLECVEHEGDMSRARGPAAGG